MKRLLSLILVLICCSAAWGQVTVTPTTETWNKIASKPEITVGDTGYLTFSAAVTAIGSTSATLVIPSGNHTAGGVTVPANVQLRPVKGAVFTVANGTTLTINGALDAGPYQIFSCAGTGKVVFGAGAVQEVYPEWWGAVGDGITTDTTALQAALTATPQGNILALQGKTYLTGPLTKADYGLKIRGVRGNQILGKGTILQALADQTHILKLYGSAYTVAGMMIGPDVEAVCLNGNSKTISDAALVLECGAAGKFRDVEIVGVVGKALRARWWWDTRFDNCWFRSVGVDGGSTIYLDDRYDNNNDKAINNFFFYNCHFETFLGTLIASHATSNLDSLQVRNSRIETTVANTAATSLFTFGGIASAIRIIDNRIAGGGVTLSSLNLTKVLSMMGGELSFTGNAFYMPGAMSFDLSGPSGPVIIKDNTVTWDSATAFTINNSSTRQSIIYEPPLVYGDGSVGRILFEGKKTPFIPIAEVGYMGSFQDQTLMVADADSLNPLGTVWQKAFAASDQQIGSFALKQFAQFPYGVAVYMRAKTDAGTVNVALNLTAIAGWGANVNFGAAYEVKLLGVITPTNLANATLYADYADLVVNTSTGTISVDGIYLVPLTGSQTVAFNASYAVNFALGYYVKTTDIGTATAVTVNAPTNPPAPGQEVLFDWTKTTNALTITWNAVFKASYVSMTASKRVVIRFIYDGTNYVQVGTPAELTP